MNQNFTPITQGFKKVERKFICIKPHLLYDYLSANTTYLHDYVIEQKYYNEYKYRKYEYNSKTTYAKHYLINRNNITKQLKIEEITQSEYESIPDDHIIRKTRSAYSINNTNLIMNIDTLDRDKLLIEVWGYKENEEEVARYESPKGILEVTKNKHFGNRYIAEHSDNILNRKLIILEGTDMIGKTTVAKLLVEVGYMILDRDQYSFSNFVVDNENPIICAKRILHQYTGRQNYKVAVMFTSDEKVLEQRLAERIAANEISEYDLECIPYNSIYIQILNQLKLENKNIIGIDVADKAPEELYKEIINQLED